MHALTLQQHFELRSSSQIVELGCTTHTGLYDFDVEIGEAKHRISITVDPPQFVISF